MATSVGTAISGIGGTVGFILFHGAEAPILTTHLLHGGRAELFEDAFLLEKAI